MRIPTTSLLSTILVGSAFAVPPPHQVPFSAPPPSLKPVPQDHARLEQDAEGAWSKVNTSMDNWAERGLKKFQGVEREGMKYESIQHVEFPSHSFHVNKVEQICDTKSKSYSGYLRTDQDANLFYWFFESRSKTPEKDPLVLWLNGGPGCSSMVGLLFELGPCTVANGGQNTTYNPYSWTESANIVFLDSPVEVGYSYGNKTVSNSHETALDVYAFFQLFYEKFPKFKDVPFHLAGESYAGTYIPHIAEVIQIFNQRKPTPSAVTIPLESVLIGNGLTDAYTQFGAILNWSCKEGGNPYGVLFDEETCKWIEGKVGTCQKLTQQCYDAPSRLTCVPATMSCWQVAEPISQTSLNSYDIRKKCEREDEDGLQCYTEMPWIATYMNQPHVRKALGVSEERTFESCNPQINQAFHHNGDVAHNTAAMIPPLLENGIRVLIFAGDADFMCNSKGTLAWTLALPWFGQNDYVLAEERAYKTRSGKKAGVTRSFGKGAGLLRWLEVRGAGHLVPKDQPEASLDFFTRWINNEDI
ncbi:hypothetical protein JCM16303_000378 [Sporobolomyces ruberrimus]